MDVHSARTGPRWRILALAAIALAAADVVVLSAPAAPAAAASPWDFDGDGWRDLAVGVQGENADAGGVLVVRGTASGLTTSRAARLGQDSGGVPGVAEPGDGFGAALASGDFDADGYADLAVGAPGEASSTEERAGAVTILFGTPAGLGGAGARVLGRPDLELGSALQEETYFGSELAAADFDADGDADLAVATRAGLGGVLVYRGGPSGPGSEPAQQVGPGRGLPATLDTGSPDGGLATGDLDGNGVPDLAAGLLNQDQAAGAVAVLYGARGRGLDLTGSAAPRPQVWTEDSPGVKGRAERLDAFGSAVGIGDVTGDGRRDLVVSAFQQPTATDGVQGALHVLKGSPAGLTDVGDQYATYDTLAADAVGKLGDQLSVGNLDGDGIADVAVSRGTRAEHAWGGVMVLHGSRSGLGAGAKVSFTQATAGVGGVFEPVDYWGLTLKVRPVGGGGVSDLVVGDPFEDDGPVPDTGSVNVLWGSTSGMSGARSTYLTQNSAGVPGTSEERDAFGLGL